MKLEAKKLLARTLLSAGALLAPGCTGDADARDQVEIRDVRVTGEAEAQGQERAKPRQQRAVPASPETGPGPVLTPAPGNCGKMSLSAFAAAQALAAAVAPVVSDAAPVLSPAPGNAGKGCYRVTLRSGVASAPIADAPTASAPAASEVSDAVGPQAATASPRARSTPAAAPPAPTTSPRPQAASQAASPEAASQAASPEAASQAAPQAASQAAPQAVSPEAASQAASPEAASQAAPQVASQVASPPAVSQAASPDAASPDAASPEAASPEAASQPRGGQPAGGGAGPAGGAGQRREDVLQPGGGAVSAEAVAFELDWLGGPAERCFRRRVRGVEDLPWGTLEATLEGAPYTPELLARARHSWTEGAFSEYCSAAAFADAQRALLECAAPIDLVGAAGDFVKDEMLHVELNARVAMELGGAAPVRADFGRLTPPPTPGASPLLRAAEVLVRTCCVGEALSVPLLGAGARVATHPLVAAVLERIVRDEGPHASLGWWFLDWAGARLDDGDRAHLAAIALEGLRAYESRWRVVTERPGEEVAWLAPDLHALGWLLPDDYRREAERAVREKVVAPLARAGVEVAPRDVDALFAC